MKFAGIIPARYASTRFPGKPLVKIGSKTMIRRVYEQSQKVIDNVFVATDDERIMNEVLSFGGKAVMTSVLHKSGTDRCAEAIQLIEQQTGLLFDVVVNIQGDEPFISPAQIELLVSSFNRPEVEIATLMKPAKSNTEIFNPDKPKVITDLEMRAIYFSRSPVPFVRGREQENWDQYHPFYMHIGLYAYRTEVLKKLTLLPQSPLELAESLEQLRWIENGFHIHVAISHAESISIDTPADLEQLIRSGLVND